MANPAFQSDAFQQDAFQSEPTLEENKIKPKGIVSTTAIGNLELDDRTLRPTGIVSETIIGSPLIRKPGTLLGSGTSSDPYQIWDMWDLAVIGTGIYGLNLYYKLMRDIDASL